MNSNARLLSILPDDLLVLPSHQTPFTGLHVRINQIIDGHRVDIQSVYDHLDKPLRVIDCFTSLFSRDITADLLGLATGETLANLNFLVHRSSIQRSQDNHGVHWYVQNPDAQNPDIGAIKTHDHAPAAT